MALGIMIGLAIAYMIWCLVRVSDEEDNEDE